jgi:hypothetical protein
MCSPLTCGYYFFIAGNSKIGKTFFSYYLLYRIARIGGTIIVHQRDMSPILFSNDKVYSHIEDNIISELPSG